MNHIKEAEKLKTMYFSVKDYKDKTFEQRKSKFFELLQSIKPIHIQNPKWNPEGKKDHIEEKI